MAANSPGGMFNPVPVPDEPDKSDFLQHYLDFILGILKTDKIPRWCQLLASPRMGTPHQGKGLSQHRSTNTCIQ
jgi:hypothetical protein